ncbi:MAG TPA: dihydrofolate reductase family protein [Anaerolineae bacterium]|nr:dihydrofolate reductase family protein [Anaerolineae bacterium]HMR65747.1 dihydrofolate reductase family protein [Anaerolineae bacterium]
MKASVYIATSLDGFIARPDGAIDWLPVGESEPGVEDYGYREFMDSVDYLVMGRGTFEVVLSFGGEWPYGEKRLVVLSSRPVEIPDRLAGTVEWLSGSPQAVVDRLAERGAQHLYVDGGKTIQGFLAAGLIQHLTITRIPILIGEGLPLFGPVPHDIKLNHIETRSFANGLVQSRYEVAG